jgi:hypothetical protein
VLEPLESVEVEVVRRLVEQEQIEPREEDRGERRAPGLAAREGNRLLLERDRQAEVGADRPRARLEVAAAEREEQVERRDVRVTPGRIVGERDREPFELALRVRDADPPGQEGGEVSPGRASGSCGR